MEIKPCRCGEPAELYTHREGYPTRYIHRVSCDGCHYAGVTTYGRDAGDDAIAAHNAYVSRPETFLESIGIDARWTADCSGKRDYDAPIMSLSCRYWPAGGSAIYVHVGDGVTVKPENNGHGPSAHASIMLGDQNLVDQRFVGPTEADARAQVEHWAEKTIKRIVRAIREMDND